jgi:hypothetical protein
MGNRGLRLLTSPLCGFAALGFMHYFSRGGGVSKSGGEWQSTQLDAPFASHSKRQFCPLVWFAHMLFLPAFRP